MFSDDPELRGKQGQILCEPVAVKWGFFRSCHWMILGRLEKGYTHKPEDLHKLKCKRARYPSFMHRKEDSKNGLHTFGMQFF